MGEIINQWNKDWRLYLWKIVFRWTKNRPRLCWLFGKRKIYYLIKYKNEGICFILIKDPEEPENYGTNKEKGNCEMKYVIREATNKDTEFICRINKYTMGYDYPEEKTQY